MLKVLNKCPLCGSELEILYLGQYSEAYKILKNGKISKVRKYKTWTYLLYPVQNVTSIQTVTTTQIPQEIFHV